MPTGTGLCLIITMAVVECVCSDPMIVATGVTVEFTCTGPQGEFLPTWLLDGSAVVTEGDCYKSRLSKSEGPNATATLTINCNHTCNMFTIWCRIKIESQFLYLHNTTLVVQGRLPSPENIHFNRSINPSTIEWNHPYSAMNDKSNIMRVIPHISNYTVYISDNFTGDIVKQNVTDTQFMSNSQDDGSCPMYHVSAWNAGGESEMSIRIPHPPRKVAAGNVVIYAATSQILHVHVNVTDPCEMKIPNFFNITVMTSDRVVIKTVQHDHQSGPQVRIELPRNVNMCSLVVSISAGNSAGMSSPTEIEVECPTTTRINISDSTLTTSTGTDATTLVVTVEPQQRDNMAALVAIAVGAVVVGLVIMAATLLFIVWKYKRKVKVEITAEKNIYIRSSSHGTSGQDIQVSRTQTSVSAHSSQSSADSQTSLNKITNSSKQVAENHPPPALGSPQPVVYAQLESLKHTGPQPPSIEDPVLYTPIKHQD